MRGHYPFLFLLPTMMFPLPMESNRFAFFFSSGLAAVDKGAEKAKKKKRSPHYAPQLQPPFLPTLLLTSWCGDTRRSAEPVEDCCSSRTPWQRSRPSPTPYLRPSRQISSRARQNAKTMSTRTLTQRTRVFFFPVGNRQRSF